MSEIVDVDHRESILPLLQTLPSMMQSMIQNLQQHLGLAYPLGNIRTSPEINAHPLLGQAIKVILALPNYQGTYDMNTRDMMMAWLDLHWTDLPTIAAAKNLLNHPGILREIYSRGLANHFPPIFTLGNFHPQRKFIETETNYTTIKLKGEILRYVCVTTPCLYRAWISTFFQFDLASVTTNYTVEIMLDKTNVCLDKDLTALYKHEYDRCLHAPKRPISFFIYNTRGVASLPFIAHLRRIMLHFQPDVIVLTETRSAQDIAGLPPSTGHYSTLYSLHPVCFVGGLRIMYDNRILNAEVINREGQSFSAQLSFVEES